MAKQADLENVELKVFVNCCDGCKRKIKKVLWNLDEILGNVDPQTLIKKLSEAGKQAEFCSQFGNEIAGLGKRGGVPKTEEKGNPENGNERAKYREYPGVTGKINKGNGKLSPQGKNTSTMNCFVHQETLPIEKINQVMSCTPQCHAGDPCSTITAIPNLHYAMPSSYVGAPVLVTPTPTCNGMLQNCAYKRVGLPSAFQTPATPATRVGDYFSDDNTMGCHIL